MLRETPLTCYENIHDGAGLNVKMKFKLPSHKNVLWKKKPRKRGLCSNGLRAGAEADFFTLLPGTKVGSGDWLWGLALEVEMKWLKHLQWKRAWYLTLEPPAHPPRTLTSSPSNQQIHSCLGISYERDREVYLMINSWSAANANQCPSDWFGHWSTKLCKRSKRWPCTQFNRRPMKHRITCFSPKPPGVPSPVPCVTGLMPWKIWLAKNSSSLLLKSHVPPKRKHALKLSIIWRKMCRQL